MAEYPRHDEIAEAARQNGEPRSPTYGTHKQQNRGHPLKDGKSCVASDKLLEAKRQCVENVQQSHRSD